MGRLSLDGETSKFQYDRSTKQITDRMCDEHLIGMNGWPGAMLIDQSQRECHNPCPDSLSVSLLSQQW